MTGAHVLKHFALTVDETSVEGHAGPQAARAAAEVPTLRHGGLRGQWGNAAIRHIRHAGLHTELSPTRFRDFWRDRTSAVNVMNRPKMLSLAAALIRRNRTNKMIRKVS
jgi:hypothetical protein